MNTLLRFVIILSIINVICTNITAQDSLKNLPELSLPITNTKMVIAHCMTNIIRYKNHPFEDGCNPAYYNPSGNISSSLGGLTQVLPMEDSLLKNASLDSAVLFEMHAAVASGIDGFQFYYTLGNKSWDDIIEAYFRVADKENIPFKFTFCISHASGRTEDDKIAEFAQRINNIMQVVGHENKHWLRTPDGRLIMYLWYGEQLADIPADKNMPDAFYAARAFRKLANAVNEQFACIYVINEKITKEKLNSWLDYFPACWVWTLPYTKNYIGNMIADVCRQRHRTFTGSTFNDFYTSKLLGRGTWNMYKTAETAANTGIDKVERKYIVTGLSYNFRQLFQFGIDQNVPIMNIITWNDYPEGHHLAPEINHNEGFSILLNYYKSMWQKKTSPYAGKDVAVIFFKKYKHDIKPSPYNIRIVDIEHGINASSEDSIEVITMLKQDAMLEVNNQSRHVTSGFASTKFIMQKGNIDVAVLRDDSDVIHFTTPQAITDHPFRTDKITCSYSSEHMAFYQSLFTKQYLLYIQTLSNINP
jgi:hypothetical protein